MKILQVCPQYFPDIGGLEEHVRNISERLAKEHEVTIFAGDPSGKLLEEEEIGGVRIRRFKTFAPGNAYYLSLEMAKELKKSTFDIVHGHSYHALPLYFAKNADAKRFIVTPHYHGHGHSLFRNLLIKLYKPFGKKIFEKANRVIAVSRYERQLLLRDFAIDENKISIIPNGVDLREISEQEVVPRELKTILCVSRLEEYKGVQHIIEILPLVDKAIHLEIVGMGPYKSTLMAQIDKLGLADRVKFYQDLSRRELLDMYAKAGIFVLLSQHEAFSIVVAEALASRTPCIVANTSALSEWVDTKNCFGIDSPVDGHELAELVSRVIGTKISGVKLWDWAEVTQKITRLYEDISA